MKIVKYILSCIVQCFDALVGRGMTGDLKEGIIGLASLTIIVSIFLILVFVLDKIIVNYKVSLFCALIGTLAIVLIMFLLLIFVEKIFLV